MNALTPDRLRKRLGFDWRVVTQLEAPSLGTVRAFADAAALRSGRVVTPEEGERGSATIFVIEYLIPTLVGPGVFTPQTTVRFDLMTGNYPFTSPTATVLSRPLPWTPHVQPQTGMVCMGQVWQRSGGRMLFPQLVVHVAHMLNFDEPDRGPAYVGWNAEAINYWRKTLRGRPLHPDLQYPVLPLELTHGISAAGSGMRILGAAPTDDAEGGFRFVRTEPVGDACGFRLLPPEAAR